MGFLLLILTILLVDLGIKSVIEDGDQIYHGEDAPADAIPGGASPVGELPQAKGEDIQPARHDLLPPGE